MKDGSKGKINDLFVVLKSKMRCIKENDVDGKEKKEEKELIKMLLKTRNMNNVLMFCVIKKWPDLTWKEFKADCIELELLMFVKFLPLVLMMKDTF